MQPIRTVISEREKPGAHPIEKVLYGFDRPREEAGAAIEAIDLEPAIVDLRDVESCWVQVGEATTTEAEATDLGTELHLQNPAINGVGLRRENCG